MSFCPNLSNPQIKEEFDALVSKYGSASATYIWTTRERANNSTKVVSEINETTAKSWLAERFPGMAVEFYDTAKQIGDGYVHGYVHNAGMYLWTAAESGTEYHEAYHMTFRNMLSDTQRQDLYKEAAKQFGQPTTSEVENILSQFPTISTEEATNLVLEEKMAEEFREYVLTEEESGKTISSKIAKWFKNLFNWIKAMISDNLSLKQTYSLIQSNNMNRGVLNRKVFRNPQKFQGHNVAYMHRPEYNENEFIEVKDTLYTIFMDSKHKSGDKFNVSEALGMGEDRGYIADGLSIELYRNKTTGQKVSIPQAKELLAAELAYNNNKTPETAAAVKEVFARLDATVPTSNPELRKMYYDIQKNWNTSVNQTTGNVETWGWRDILIEKLADAAIKITSKSTVPTTQPSTSIKEGVSELFESNPTLANSVYEAIGFGNLITPNDKIVFGHPGIGKTYLKESGKTNVIDFDSDYKGEINEQFNLPKGFKARNDFQKSNKEEYQEAVRKLWIKAKQEAKSTGKQLFASDMILLREFANDFDKVITMSKDTFISRAKQRNDYTAGVDGTEKWKNSLDIEISKIDKSKVVSTDKYLSDLFITLQQKQQAQQAYSNYLDTVFPDSKVKDIVYHGTPYEFDKFLSTLRGVNTGKSTTDEKFDSELATFFTDSEYTAHSYSLIGTQEKRLAIASALFKLSMSDNMQEDYSIVKEKFPEIVSQLKALKEKGLNTKDSIESLQREYSEMMYTDIINMTNYLKTKKDISTEDRQRVQKEIEELVKKGGFVNNTKRVILNIQNPIIKDFDGQPFVDQPDGTLGAKTELTKLVNTAIKNSNDAVIANNIKDPGIGTNYAIIDTKNAHILGGKQDIQGFKEFITQSFTSVKEGVAYELQDEDLPIEEQDAIEHELEVIDGVVEKIYGKSNLEDKPSKRLTGKIKELLSTIKSGKINKFGQDTYIDRDIVYQELLEAFTNKQSFTDMIASLKNVAKYKPQLAPVVSYMTNLSASDRAMFFNAFSLATTEFVLLKKRTDKKNAYVDIINPNRKSKAFRIVDTWRTSLINTGSAESRGIYSQAIIEQTNQETNEVSKSLSSTPIKEKIDAIDTAFTKLDALLPKRLVNSIPMEQGKTNPLVAAVGDVMWAMGLNVGDNMNIQQTYDNIHKIVSNGFFFTSSDTGRLVEVNGEAAISILRSKLNALRGKIKEGSNYITDGASTAIELADFFAPVLSIAGEGFVKQNGSKVYATNLQSHAQEIMNEFANNPTAIIQKYMNDPSIGANGVAKYQSILFRYLSKSKDFQNQFKLADLDAFSESDRFDDATAYEDMNKIDSYVIRINQWINGNVKDTTRIFLPIQADREKYSVITMPRILQGTFGMKNQEGNKKEDLVKAQIVQDFLRIAEAKRVVNTALTTKDFSTIIDGYHNDPRSKEFMDSTGKYLGRAFDSKFFQFTGRNELGAKIVTDKIITKPGAGITQTKSLSDVIEKYIKNEVSISEKEAIDVELNRMTGELLTYMNNQAAKLKEILGENISNTPESRIGLGNTKGLNIDEVLQAFVFEETLLRNEIVKLFRISRAYSKDLTDFYKRMGHLTSPGSKYALKSDKLGSEAWLNGEAYGMMDTYTELTLEDIKLNINQGQITRTNKAADELFTELSKTMSPELAKSMSDFYRPGIFDSTDAQAFINIDMYRGLMQGEGKWFENEEAAYNAYKNSNGDSGYVYQPGFVPDGFVAGDTIPIYPIKTYFEQLETIGRSLVPVSEKNSYSVLLKSYTKDYPQLEDLRQRMEGQGTYQGLPQINVVNFVSGKKLAKKNVYKVRGVLGEYANIVTSTNSSKGLRKPQSIPEMKSNPVATINRQIKKNMIANVGDTADYFLNSGITSIEQKLTGKELKNIYHGAIEEKLEREMKGVMDELKITDLEAALSTTDAKVIDKAKLDLLKNIREIIYKQILDGDLHSNYYKSLDIEFDSKGSPRFKVPLDMPIYNAKFESIIMSIMHNRVFKQSTTGFEAVQVAELGPHGVDDELKFLTIESKNGKQRLVHAEIRISEELGRRFGIQPGQSLDEVPEELRRILGYRIPNQDKASTVILIIKSFIPSNMKKSIIVPGGLVKLMGSDHDVDKLFLLFPRVEQDPNSKYGIRKVLPNYKALLKNINTIKDKSITTNAMLDNIIMDSMEAVMSNSAHFRETLSPLDGETLQSEVVRIRKALPEFNEATDWNDVSTETNALLRNQASNKLRGVYANIIAGRNVAQHGIVNINKDYSIKIVDAAGTLEEFDTYRTYTKEGIPTDKVGSLFLSAAVDGGKDPLQLELNDNLATAPIRALFIAYHDEYASTTATNFLNQPYVRRLTEVLETKYDNNPAQVLNAYKAIKAEIQAEMKTRGITPTTAVTLDTDKSLPMKSTELSNLSKENRDLNEQLIFINNFVAFSKSGRKLLDLYKRITPDAMDGLNRLGAINSFKDRSLDFEGNLDQETGEYTDQMFFGPDPNQNVIDQFVGENSVYGIQRGYENLVNRSLKVAEYIFPIRTSPAFTNFKEVLREASGNKRFTFATHDQIDSNLMFMTLTKPDSPFLRYLDESYATKMYSNPLDNIGTRLNALKKEFPKLGSTKFLQNMIADVDIANNFYGVKFDGSFDFSRSEREQFTAALKGMMYTPQVFLNVPIQDIVIKNEVIQDEKQRASAEAIKELGQQLSMNTFLTSAFRRGASSYHDIIPIEFLSQKQITNRVTGEGKSILDFIYDESSKMGNKSYFYSVDLLKYMEMFGPMKAEGIPLLKRVSSRTLNEKTTELSSSRSEKFVVFRNSKTNIVATFMNIGESNAKGKNRFVRLDSGYKGKAIYSLPSIQGETKIEKYNALKEYIQEDQKLQNLIGGSVINCAG